LRGHIRDAVLCLSGIALLLGFASSIVFGAHEPSSANLLANPSFESVDEKDAPAEWSFSRVGESQGSLRLAQEGRTGKRAAVLTKTSAAGRYGVYAAQSLRGALDPDTTYVFTAWVKCLAEREARFDLYIEAAGEKPPPGLKRHHKMARKSFIPTRQWKQYRVEIALDSDHHYAGGRLIVQLYTADTPIAIDDVSFAAAPGDVRPRRNFLTKGPAFYELSHDVVTPHVAWAKPYYLGPTRVLVIAPQATQRETLEIAQRLDIDFTTAFTSGGDAIGFDPAAAAPYEMIQGMFAEDVEKNILEKVKKPCDVIILGSIDWDALSLDIKYEILRAVKSGAGLVIGFEPAGKDAIYEKAFANPLPDREKYITAGVPLMGLPAFAKHADKYPTVDALRARYVRTARLGEGRIVCLRYAGNIWYRWRYLSPQYRYGPTRSFLEYDYYLSLAAKAILWAAGKEPDVLVSSIAPAQSPIAQKDLGKDPLKLGLFNDGEARELSFRVVARDPNGRSEGESSFKRSVPAGKVPLAFELPHLTTGRHFVDVFIQDGDAVVNWASATIDVTGPVAITAIELDPQGYDSGDTIKGKLVLEGAAPPKATAVVEFYDNHGRLRQVLSPAIGAGTKTVGFSLAAGEPLAVMHRIVARIVADDATVARAQADFPIRMAPPDDFQWIVWGFVSTDYVVRHALKELRGLGVDAILACAMYDTNMARIADIAYREDLQLVPYSTRLVDTRTDSYNKNRKARTGKDLIREPCLTDPEYLAQEKAKVGGVAKALAKYAPIAYSLGDEGGFATGKHDLCHSETCQADFRVFLKEMYVTLEALNAEWDTSYTSWNEIRKMTLAEARETGNFAPWCDHRLHSDAVWTRTHAILRDEIRKYQSNAKVGDASYSYVGSYTATDWPEFADTIGFMQTYTSEVQTPSLAAVKMIERDLFRGKDIMFGYCYGGYEWLGLWTDRTEDTQRYYPWRTLFEGGNSLMWFHGFGGSAKKPGSEAGMAPDLTAYDIFKWAAQEIGEVKRGPGKLLMNADRLHDGVAVLYSQSSIHASAIDETLTKVLERRGFMLPYTRLFADLGINPVFIATQDIEGGRLERRDIRALVLPFCQALSDEQCDRILEFARAGGTVIADLRPAVMDEHCKFRQTGGLDELFGTTRRSTEIASKRGEIRATTPGGREVNLAMWRIAETNVDSTTAKALGSCVDTPVLFVNAYGKGRGIHLAFALDSYESSWEDARGAGMRAMMSELLEDADVRPQPAVASDDEMNLRSLRRARFSCGGLQYLGLVRDIENIGGPADKSPKPLHVKLAKSAHLYDVRGGKYLGHKDSFDVKIIPARAQLYAMLPYRVKGIEVKRLKSRYKPGDTVTCQLRVEPEKGQPGRHVLRVELAHPSGKSPTPYARNIVADDGKCDARFRLALNDPSGKWTLTVRDVATGTVARKTFTLEK